MMKILKNIWLVVVASIYMLSCNNSYNNEFLQHKVDSLQKVVDNNYKPGLGENMLALQTHHAKMWWAAKNKNWKLADFEVKEMIEIMDGIKKYNADRTETKMITTMDLSIENINKSISSQNIDSFKTAFIMLTNTCNNCHADNHFEFNKIKIPENNTFSNQQF